jgi:diacylglycerol kinase (ATP)
MVISPFYFSLPLVSNNYKKTMAKFSINQRIRSFKYAWDGIWFLLLNEHNAWIHSFVAIVVICCGFFLKITSNEWIIVLFSIGFVFTSELINSAIEQLCNAVSAEFHPLIKKAKDLSAGAVLIAAITAAIVGVIVFLPKLIALF